MKAEYKKASWVKVIWFVLAQEGLVEEHDQPACLCSSIQHSTLIGQLLPPQD